MNHKQNLEGETHSEKHEVGSLFVVPLPGEVAYPLRLGDFTILREGAMAAKDLRLRDLFMGISVTTLVGLLGLIAGIDWNHAIASRNWFVLVSTIFTGVIFVSTAAISIYLQARVTRHENDSAYSRLIRRIEEWFKEHGQR